MPQREEEAMSFQGVKLREDRSTAINQSRIIRAGADTMKQQRFTAAANRTQASVVSTPQDTKNLYQTAVLNPESCVHENPQFGEKALKSALRLNNQETNHGFTKYQASSGKSIFNEFNSLLVAVDSTRTRNVNCERGCNAMKNIITDNRNMITTNDAANLLFISRLLWGLQAKDGIQSHL